MSIVAVITGPIARAPVRSRAPRLSRPRHDSDALGRLCKALEIRIIPTKRRPRENETAAAATLRKILAQHGEAHFVMLIRTIAESEGNSRALVAPILWAINDVMLAFPAWPNKGLEWLASFDAINLQSLLRLARPLCNVSKQKPRAAIGGMLIQLLQPRFDAAR